MLSFDHRPPRGPEDVHITHSGNTLLESAIGVDTQWALTAYGRVAAAELIDAFDGDISPDKLETYCDSLREEVDSSFGYDAANFWHGMQSGASILEHAKAPA